MQKYQLDKILIIGTGGLALSFASALVKSEKYIVYSQGSNSKNTKEFCKKYKTLNFSELENKNDLIVLLAVPDSQIELCTIKYGNHAKLIVHFSGTTPLEILTKHAADVAVCWPLESFSRIKKVNLSKVICGVNASNEYSSQLILDLINNLKLKYIFLNNEERMKLHLTAVVLNNFIYHLLVLTKEWTKNENINSLLLQNILKKTTASFFSKDNGENQTGPAIRKDEMIIQKHLSMLKGYPELQDIYKVFTKSIIEKYSN